MSVPEWQESIRQAEKLFDQKQYEQAARLAESALRLHPGHAAAYQVLGLVCSETGRPQDAIPLLARAVALQPDLVHAHNGLGRCHYLIGDLESALHHLESALCLQPDHGFAHFNRAMVWLKQGRFHDGWIEYEWRWNSGLVQRTPIPRPRWDGAPLHGRGIMVHTEQGIGDAIQFVRFLPELKRQGGRIVFACQKALHPLFRSLPYVDEWFPIDEPAKINFELYAPLLSLPGLMRVDESGIPRKVPCIFADPARIERWRTPITSLPGMKIGLCWQGSPTFKADRLRSIPLATFEPVAQAPGITLISLQKGPGEEQIEPQRSRVPLQVFDDLDRDGAFVDTAAIMHHLDLVITSDTAVAHLAGALGQPVWTLLSVGCDWRWLTERGDSPWYPTMRLFRQRRFGDWAGVMAEVVTALRSLKPNQMPQRLTSPHTP